MPATARSAPSNGDQASAVGCDTVLYHVVGGLTRQRPACELAVDVDDLLKDSHGFGVPAGRHERIRERSKCRT